MPGSIADAAAGAGPRILVVTNLYPSETAPAFGTFVANHVESLRRLGATVEVAAIRDDRVHRGIARKYAGLAGVALAHAIRARLARRPFAIVEAHIAFPTGVIAWPVATLGGGRLVLFAHGSDVTRLPWTSPTRRRLARRLFRHAALVVANSEYTAGIAAERLGPLQRRPLIVTPGVKPASEPDGDAGRQGIVFVGRLVAGKGLPVLLDAVGRLGRRAAGPGGTHNNGSGPALTIVGDGPDRAGLERTAGTMRAAGVAIEFVGARSPEEVAAILRRAAVVAVPSTAPEGLGLVALEGMAHGALVVATGLGGLAETMDDGVNGFVVAADDAAALADGLARALDAASGPEGARLRAAGRRTAAAHDPDTANATILAAYASLR